MKRTIFFGLALMLAAVSQAQVALDEASNTPYAVGLEYIQVGTPPGDQTLATNGMNGGFGFDKWQRGGYGTPPNNGTTLITNVSTSFNMGTQQWGMRSGPGGAEGADARRRLTSDLPIGATLSFSMMVGGNGAGTVNTMGFYGVELRSSLLSNPGRDLISINGDPFGNWSVFGSDGRVETGIPMVPGQRVDVKVKAIGGDVFQVDMTPFGGTTLTYTRLSLSPGQLIRAAQFYVFGTDGDFYMNFFKASSAPPTEVVAPTSFSISLGKLSGGTVASLGAEDGNALTICKFIVPNQTVAPVTVQFDGKSSFLSCSALKLDFVSRMNSAGLFGLTLDMFNWTTNDWDLVNTVTTSVNTTYSLATLNATGNLANLLKSTDGSLRARFRVKQTGPAANLQWCHEIDKATWTVTPPQ